MTSTVKVEHVNGNKYDSDTLPPGAGDPGSNVEDVRLPSGDTAPTPSSDDVPADRQAEHDAARTRNSPRGTL